MALKSKTQRSLLLGFIGSISLCGLLGIYCLLVGTMGWLEERILGSTAVVGAASILALGSAIPWERRRWHPIGMLGIVSAAFALVLVLVAIWWNKAEDIDGYEEVMLIACVFGVALPHVALLSLARLKGGYEWVRMATVLAIALLAGGICLIILNHSYAGDFWARMLGVFAICVGCGTIAVPILHRISSIRDREAVKTFDLTLQLTCPRCSLVQQLAVGRSKCCGCGLRFLIEIEEERCEQCGYSLYKLESAACPECGTPILRRVPGGGEGSSTS